MATAYKNTNGYFVCQFRFNGKRYAKSFSSMEEAEKFRIGIEEDLRVAKRNGTVPAFFAKQPLKPLSSDVSNPTADDFIKLYEAECDHETQTLKSYKNGWKSLTSHVKFKRLSDLKPEQIQQWKRELQKGGLALPTCNSYLQRVRVLMNWAVKKKMIVESPAKDVKFLREDKLDPKPYLTKTEIDTVLLEAMVHCRDKKVEKEIVENLEQDTGEAEEGEGFLFPTGAADIYWVFLLGIYAGLRLNEIVNARWEWVNTPRALDAGGSITVQAGYGFRVKARQARTIPLHSKLRPLMYAKDFFGPTGYIVKPHITEWKPDSYRWDCRSQFRSVLKAAGLKTVNRYGADQSVTPHILRHTFCSMLAQAGYSAFEIMKLAGHSDIKVSESYMHLAPHEKGIDW